MAEGDGNGWADCAQGHRHWGRHGAAGLLACAPGPDGQASVLLMLRADWTQHAGTWGPPGGARDSHESAAGAALREAAEECAVPPGAARIHGLLDDDHGGWSYQTLVAGADRAFGVWAGASGNRYGSPAKATMDPATIGPAGGAQPHLNLSPFLTLNYCIALNGVYPT